MVPAIMGGLDSLGALELDRSLSHQRKLKSKSNTLLTSGTLGTNCLKHAGASLYY